MSVRRRTQRYTNGKPVTRWVVDVKYRHPDGRVERVRRVPRVQSRVGAERLERELLVRLERGLGVEKENAATTTDVPTLVAFWKRFLTTHVVPNNKPSEQWTKGRIMAGHLLPCFGQHRLDAISAREVDEYKARLSKLEYAPKTINNHLTVLRTILRTAVHWDVISKAPHIKLLRVERREVVFLDFDEAAALIEAASGTYKAMIALALNTGLRIGELLALQWGDFSKAERRIRVARTDWQGLTGSTKSGQARDVPLNQVALQTLTDLEFRPRGLVFCGAGGTALRYRQANWAIEQIAKKVGEKKIGWHTLRHTFASHLVMRGVPLTAVQQLLGHSTQAMTERYAHLTPAVKRDAVDALNS